jgi:hypothetical protein
MKLRRFQTNKWLWLLISLLLFIPGWFFRWIGKGDEQMPVVYLQVLITDPSHFWESLVGVCFFTLLYGVPAVGVGWVLQGVLVTLRGKREEGGEHAA